MPEETWAPDWMLSGAVVVAALSLLGLLLRQIGPWRKQITDTEERLRKELMEERARCERDLRLVRHRERGSRQLIYSLLHLFDLSPEKREGALENIRATLEQMERSEMMEMAIFTQVPAVAPEADEAG